MNNPLDPSAYCERSKPKEEDIRGPFYRDQTAIIHSMAFRRLKNKTQVFFSPTNDHICTRIEHVMHVATVAKTICKGLNLGGWKLDDEMAYAIGLGHDLGHAPFGHAGETALSNNIGRKFIHEVHSYRVAEHISNDGTGLNLTYGVKDGIIHHNGENFEQSMKPDNSIKNLEEVKDRKGIPSSYEGCIVRFSDKIAYLGRDIEDAILGRIIRPVDIPKNVEMQLGSKNGEIINRLILDLIESSKDTDEIRLSDNCFGLLLELKTFNYDRIYNHENLSDYKLFINRIITQLYEHFSELLNKNGKDYEKYSYEKISVNKSFGNYLRKMRGFYESTDDPTIIVTDYIAGMTDNFALDCMREISLPKPLIF